MDLAVKSMLEDAQAEVFLGSIVPEARERTTSTGSPFDGREVMPSRSAPRTPTEPASLPRDPALLGPVVHPGEMLLGEFLRPLGLRQSVVAAELGMSRNRLNELVLGKRSVTADTNCWNSTD